MSRTIQEVNDGLELLKQRQQNALVAANAATSKVDTNITDAINSLIKLVVAERLDLKTEITYTNGEIVNTGLDTTFEVGTYRINAANDAFEISELARYTTGMDGDTNGAIMLQHDHLNVPDGGAYTVVKDYNFRTNDFTISTWFNIPTFTIDASENSNTYLFGINHPDATTGFSVCLKPTELRLKFDETINIITVTYEKGTWNNVVLSREGDTLKLYFNGAILGVYDLPEGCDFGTKDLAFGGYYGFANENGQLYYHKNWMYYDNVQVYGKALTEEQINNYILV